MKRGFFNRTKLLVRVESITCRSFMNVVTNPRFRNVAPSQSGLEGRHVSTLTTRPPKTLPNTKIHGSIVIACGILAIWNAHWRFIFDDQSFNPQAIANTAIQQILRIEQEQHQA
ncbi:predicted protein [Lichtheimia corymbifera JMRC:FSU:9682]|uniref:Uncharacterized protein n=1 Tax=Lichtheimia corymbifera JMRC:FSU:9682 TaxID=1263082 RepID=A0A068S529_9FUNG|nr:predicted protein [Lichtheimia corymbifera JMRC:FSU:9682]